MRALAARLGRDLEREGVQVVPIGGAQAIRRVLESSAGAPGGRAVRRRGGARVRAGARLLVLRLRARPGGRARARARQRGGSTRDRARSSSRRSAPTRSRSRTGTARSRSSSTASCTTGRSNTRGSSSTRSTSRASPRRSRRSSLRSRFRGAPPDRRRKPRPGGSTRASFPPARARVGRGAHAAVGRDGPGFGVLIAWRRALRRLSIAITLAARSRGLPSRRAAVRAHGCMVFLLSIVSRRRPPLLAGRAPRAPRPRPAYAGPRTKSEMSCASRPKRLDARHPREGGRPGSNRRRRGSTTPSAAATPRPPERRRRDSNPRLPGRHAGRSPAELRLRNATRRHHDPRPRRRPPAPARRSGRAARRARSRSSSLCREALLSRARPPWDAARPSAGPAGRSSSFTIAPLLVVVGAHKHAGGIRTRNSGS